jgi:redox-sensitive bicupin YhaK (pirin superfamily)
MKKIIFTTRVTDQHWVGDGFPVRSLFTYEKRTAEFSPFLLLDYAGPHDFTPTTEKRGVGEHPHRGFETVTIVYDGEVDHRDSSGGGGRIRSGDVQWMTAASGLVHEEFHSEEFAKKGGRFEMVQLWVNLPQREKMSPPRYQGIKSSQIPIVNLSNHAGRIRVIAGTFEGTRGPAHTMTPINLWDLHLEKEAEATFSVPSGHTALVVLLAGSLTVSGEAMIGPQLALLERTGDQFSLRAETACKALFLGGEPINEPVVAYGPFVMNSSSAIQQAFSDYQEGRMGRLHQIEGSER